MNPKPRDDTLIEKLHKVGYTISQDTELIQHVEFDVALTATEGTETKGGIGFVAKVLSSLSRVKFKVPLTLP